MSNYDFMQGSALLGIFVKSYFPLISDEKNFQIEKVSSVLEFLGKAVKSKAIIFMGSLKSSLSFCVIINGKL